MPDTRRPIVRSRIGLVLPAVLIVAACSGGSSTSNNPSNPPNDPPNDPPTVGLDARPQNLSCTAPARGVGGGIDVVDAFPGLATLTQPTKILMEPVANPRWFVLQKTGALRVFDPDDVSSLTTWLTLTVRTNSEGGLLGMAFHPNYPAVPEVFLSYTIDGTSTPMRSVFSRFILDDVNSPGAGTVEQVILEVDQDNNNHNGGDIAFGADGYLYIGLGDGGGANDPFNRSQDTRYLLGSFLRIDVTGPGVSFPANPYDIPTDNPFEGNPECGPGLNAMACPEIYAIGLRNPWRWSFDPPTGVLWAADVGQNAWEEIDQIELNGNYGWDCREGAHNTSESGNCSGGLTDPVSEYPHGSGNGSITGGFVYRGTEIPSLFGRYVFADYSSGRIWALQSDGAGGYTNEELANTATGPSSFGVDQSGELYFTDLNNGRIMRLQSAGGGVDPVPDLLSDSGCVDPADTSQAYAGLVPYAVNAPFWSDGAIKERFIGLPDGTTIAINGDDDWIFPAGTVLVKNFRLNGQLIETRHLMRHPDGVWAGYTYEWNDLQTEATRVRGGKTENIDGQDWIFPDEAECLACHTAAAGVALGAETAQLNSDFTYAATGRTHNQLETLDGIMMFSAPLAGTPATLPALPDPFDMSASLDSRARAYLHTNCSQCHRPGGPTPVDLDLRYDTTLANTNACNVAPQSGDLGLPSPQIIDPGDAANSVLALRTALRDSNGMPPLSSSLVDSEGVQLLNDWINGLAACN